MKKWKQMARRLAGSLLAACVAVGALPVVSHADNPIAQNISTWYTMMKVEKESA